MYIKVLSRNDVLQINITPCNNWTEATMLMYVFKKIYRASVEVHVVPTVRLMLCSHFITNSCFAWTFFAFEIWKNLCFLWLCFLHPCVWPSGILLIAVCYYYKQILTHCRFTK